MDLDSLRCFVAVATTLRFRTAAQRMGLSAAALSDRIQRLEEALGAPLLERSTRRVRLSPAGARLLPRAQALLADAEACRQAVRADDRPAPFALTLGTRYELGLSWLCPLLGELAAGRPERTLHLYMGDTDALLEHLERGRVDAVVLSARLTRPHLRYALLHEEEYRFVAAAEGPARPEEAAEFTLIDATPDLPLFRYLADAGDERRPWRFGRYLYMGGIGAIRAQVLAGRGVAVLPRYFVAEDLHAGRLRDLSPKRGLRTDWFRLVWLEHHPHEPELEALAEVLRSHPLR